MQIHIERECRLKYLPDPDRNTRDILYVIFVLRAFRANSCPEICYRYAQRFNYSDEGFLINFIFNF